MNTIHPPGVLRCDPEELTKILGGIRLVATDCDGVLTDGGLYYSETAGEIKKFSVLDGMGFVLLRNAGIKTAIITAKTNPLVEKRAADLRVDFLIMGESDKLRALEDICAQAQIPLACAAYVGDDIPDVAAIRACGFGCAPRSAHKTALDAALYVTAASGGEGCLRELADLITSAQDTGENG